MDRIAHSSAVDIGGGRRGFRSKDTVAGIPGTVVTAGHMNALQEELLALIELAGLVPNAADLQQLVRVVRSGAFNYRVAGGTANALTVALSPPLLAYTAGLPLTILTGDEANTGAMTVKVDDLAAIPLEYRDGGAIGAGAIPANTIIDIVCDGDSFRLMGLQLATKAQVEAGDRADLAVSAKELFAKRNPFFIASGTAPQSIPNGVDTKVTNIGAPSASYFNAGSTFAGSAFNCGAKDAGAWLFVGYGALTLATASSSGNDYRGSIAKNGATGPFSSAFLSGSSTYGVVVMNPYVMAAGDFVDFRVFQNSGTNRNLGATQLFGMRMGAAA